MQVDHDTFKQEVMKVVDSYEEEPAIKAYIKEFLFEENRVYYIGELWNYYINRSEDL